MLDQLNENPEGAGVYEGHQAMRAGAGRAIDQVNAGGRETVELGL